MTPIYLLMILGVCMTVIAKTCWEWGFRNGRAVEKQANELERQNEEQKLYGIVDDLAASTFLTSLSDRRAAVKLGIDRVYRARHPDSSRHPQSGPDEHVR